MALMVTFRGKKRLSRFQILTAVVMKNTVFWDITPGSLLNVNRLYGVISQKTVTFILSHDLYYCLHV
jgi:hypothetical protein